MNEYISIIIVVMSIGIAIFGIISFIVLIKTIFSFQKFDELQKTAFYQTLSICFILLLDIHLIQFLVSSFGPYPYSKAASMIVSVGGYDKTAYIMGNGFIDSFCFDNVLFGVVYYIRRKKYGLI